VKPSGSTSNPFALTAVHNELFFVWDDLWKCTSIGVCSIVKDLPNGSSPPHGLTRVGTHLYFVADTCGALWRTEPGVALSFGTIPGIATSSPSLAVPRTIISRAMYCGSRAMSATE